MSQLTDLKLRAALPGGKPMQDSAVSGLRFETGAQKGQGKWILRFVSPATGKRRDMGLGRYPEVTLADAREKGLAARKVLSSGKDPIDERDVEKANRKAVADALTFEQAARRVHGDNKDGWRNTKHQDQWINTLRDYVFTGIGSRKVASLTPADFADVLRPIWLSKPETASRVKQRCHKVMKWSWANGLVQGNPVDVVDHLLPRQPGKRERVRHQPAMEWRTIPDFVEASLRSGRTNVTRYLLEFVILTAARSGEARAMQWDEVDEDARVWTMPASRTKTKVEHRVPLSDAAMRVLEAQRKAHPESALVFPAPRGGVLSDMALTKFLRDQNAASGDKSRIATAHGFRSSFRDWASEQGYARDLAEKALAHAIASKTEAAYHRTDLLEQRRPMMDAWAAHVCGEDAKSNVVRMRGRK
jgi:integrase